MYIRLRGICTNPDNGVAVTFVSPSLRVSRPAQGTVAINFDDKAYDGVGGVLTLSIGAITDENNSRAGGGGAIVSRTWFRRANDSAPFVSVRAAAANENLYTLAGADFVGVKNGERAVYRLVVIYEDALDYRQGLTAHASLNLREIIPAGSVSFTPTNDAVNAYSEAQSYTATLRISNGVSGGNITYFYQRVTTTAAGYEDVSGYTSGDAVPLSGFSAFNRANSNRVLSIRMRAVYADTPNGITVTFNSEAINPDRPAEGTVSIDFPSGEQSAPGGGVLTAQPGGIFDDNDSTAQPGRVVVYIWYLRTTPEASFVQVAIGTTQPNANKYQIKASDFRGVQKDVPVVFRVNATYQDGLAYQQEFIAFATLNFAPGPGTPEGHLTLNADSSYTGSPYDIGQPYGARLIITNAATAGTITYQWQIAPQESGPFAARPGNRPDTTRAGTASTGLSNNLADIIINNQNPYFRMRAVYVDTVAAVTVTFYSRIINASQPATGMTIDFTDEAYTAAGGVLTANISGVSDPNDQSGHTGTYGAYVWLLRANESAEFITLNAAAQEYTIRERDFDNLIEGQRALYRVLVPYTDQIGYIQTITATAAVELLPPQFVPEGTLLFTAGDSAFNPYSEGQFYRPSLNITNRAGGGATVYFYEQAPASGVFADVSGYTSPNVAFLRTIGTANKVDGATAIAHIRMRAVYTDTPNSVTTTFTSQGIDLRRPTNGLVIDFPGGVQDSPGGVLTANIGSVSDDNDSAAATGTGAFTSFAWLRQANASAAYVSLTSRGGCDEVHDSNVGF